MLHQCVIVVLLVTALTSGSTASSSSPPAATIRTTVFPCTSATCRKAATLVGNFNFAAFESLPKTNSHQHSSVPPAGRNHSAGGLLAGLVSTFGLPGYVYVYFEHADQYELSREWNSSSVRPLPLFPRLPLGTHGNMFGFALQGIIEFFDKNGNGQFDPETDPTVSEYSFADLNHKWRRIEEVHQHVAAVDANVYSFNVTTEDGVVSLLFSIADKEVDVGEQTFGPDRVKVSMEINDFPYADTANDTMLALATYIVSPQGQFRAKGSAGVPTAVSVGDFGQVRWIPHATVRAAGHHSERADVHASPLSDASIGDVVFSVASTSVNDDTDVQRIYYTFDSMQPQFVYWDPTLKYNPANGDSGGNNSLNTKVFVIVSLSAVAVFAGLAIVCTVRRRNKMKQRHSRRRFRPDPSDDSYGSLDDSSSVPLDRDRW